MDTEKPRNNYTFYDGFDGEPEIVIEADDTNQQILHIWDGYWEDIFREPNFNGNGWLGFTRDYHQCEGAFGDDSEGIVTVLNEYLDDLKLYVDRNFNYKETKEVYNLLYFWLEESIKKGCKKIKIKVV